ncbi:Hypothetical protein, putative [Bodo saltans]|uniref:Uncharacterized protein n=1 Tax=Bodo saltans TaxID=75058 RepID=A0A0S4IZN7_BODSA|nr:Hypothetical protein, putative [Bodo saltans]|eukprot:CUG23176.1 Hypothetical protein, putative [Bodo saltans]
MGWRAKERTIKEYMRAPLPKMLNVNEFLRKDGRLGNDCGLELPLQERDDMVAMLKAALLPARSSGRVNVASCSSPRGSGKATLAKWFVSKYRRDAAKYVWAGHCAQLHGLVG